MSSKQHNFFQEAKHLLMKSNPTLSVSSGHMYHFLKPPPPQLLNKTRKASVNWMYEHYVRHLKDLILVKKYFFKFKLLDEIFHISYFVGVCHCNASQCSTVCIIICFTASLYLKLSPVANVTRSMCASDKKTEKPLHLGPRSKWDARKRSR